MNIVSFVDEAIEELEKIWKKSQDKQKTAFVVTHGKLMRNLQRVYAASVDSKRVRSQVFSQLVALDRFEFMQKNDQYKIEGDRF